MCYWPLSICKMYYCYCWWHLLQQSLEVICHVFVETTPRFLSFFRSFPPILFFSSLLPIYMPFFSLSLSLYLFHLFSLSSLIFFTYLLGLSISVSVSAVFRKIKNPVLFLNQFGECPLNYSRTDCTHTQPAQKLSYISGRVVTWAGLSVYP